MQDCCKQPVFPMTNHLLMRHFWLVLLRMWVIAMATKVSLWIFLLFTKLRGIGDWVEVAEHMCGNLIVWGMRAVILLAGGLGEGRLAACRRRNFGIATCFRHRVW